MVVTYNNLLPRIGFLSVCFILALNGSAGVRADEKDPLKDDLLKLNSYAKEEDQLKQLRMFVKDREKGRKMVSYAAQMLKEAKGDEKPFNYNGSSILARAAHYLKQYEIAEKFYELGIDQASKVKNGKKMVAAYEGLINFYTERKRYADVIETCEKILELTGPKDVKNFQLLALDTAIRTKAKQGKIEEALRDNKNLLDNTNLTYFLETKAFIQREDGKLKDAISTYKEALEKLDEEKEISKEDLEKEKDRIHYLLSGVYVENKEIDKAAEELKSLIKKHPDDAIFKNDLGFVWCDSDMKLEESEKLIKEALELDKKEKEKSKAEGKLEDVTENVAYLDSLGWVYYKQKKYKEALEPLKKAALDEDEGNHLEIWDHLADCYLALGKKKEAIESWEKALKMEDVSPRDGERRRKVSEKLKKARLDVSK
jgi:tetratricopeptide (TPR) repeat protein